MSRAIDRRSFMAAVGGTIGGVFLGGCSPYRPDDVVNVAHYGVHPGVRDNSRAFNRALEDAVANKRSIAIPAGRYRFRGPILKDAGFFAPSIQGEGPLSTIFDFTDLNAGAAWGIRGGSGQLSGGVIRGIGFITGNDTPLIEIDGQCGMLVSNCHFESSKPNSGTAVLFHNKSPGSFTEFNILDRCQFGYRLKKAVVYRRSRGAESFHGSGVINSIINGSGAQIDIGVGAHVYNAPLTCTAFTNADGLIVNASVRSSFFVGHVGIEGDATIACGEPLYLCGTVGGAGRVRLGSLILCDSISHAGPNNHNVLNVSEKPFRRVVELVSGENRTGINVGNACDLCIVKIQVRANKFEQRGVYYAEHNGYGGAGIVQAISTGYSDNSAGWKVLPSYAVDAKGELVIRIPDPQGWCEAVLTVSRAAPIV